MQISIRMGNKHVDAELPQKRFIASARVRFSWPTIWPKKAQSIRGRLWQQAPENRMPVKTIKDFFFCVVQSAGK